MGDKKVEKRYVATKRIPEYCPFGSVMTLEVDSENDAPTVYGRVVGFQYEGSDEIISTIEGDGQKAKDERVFDRLMFDGFLVKHKTKKDLGKYGPCNVTEYAIMYEAEDSTKHKNTRVHGIPSPKAGRFVCLFELYMVTEIGGEVFERYLTIEKSTPPVFRFVTTDFYSSVSTIITTMLCRNECGFQMLADDSNMNRCMAKFYDSFGEKKNIIFNNTKDLLNTIISVKLVDVKPMEVAENAIAG